MDRHIIFDKDYIFFGQFSRDVLECLKHYLKLDKKPWKTMKARFNGKCVECGESIKVGKEILKNSNDKWVHKSCSDLEEELPWI